MASLKSCKNGHECVDGLYIGYSTNPARRWEEHVKSAFEETDRNHHNSFKNAIRAHPEGFKHFILAVASTDSIAQTKEAAAIRFYKPRLNTREPSALGEHHYTFRALNNTIVSSLVMRPRSQKKEQNTKSDSDRVTVEAIVSTQGERKRLKTLRVEPFEKIMNISCHKQPLDDFGDGTIVKLKVALAGGEERGTYLKAARTASITLVR